MNKVLNQTNAQNQSFKFMPKYQIGQMVIVVIKAYHYASKKDLNFTYPKIVSNISLNAEINENGIQQTIEYSLVDIDYKRAIKDFPKYFNDLNKAPIITEEIEIVSENIWLLKITA